MPQTPESPPPPPDRVLEPPASPEPSERGNPPRVRGLSSDSHHLNSTEERATSVKTALNVDARDSPLSPPPAEQHAVSDEYVLLVVSDYTQIKFKYVLL